MRKFETYKRGDGSLETPEAIIGDKGWLALSFLGGDAYSNGHLILIGKPPGKKPPIAKAKPSCGKIEKALGKTTAPMAPVGHDASDEGMRVVFFEGLKMPIQARYYDHILSVYPDATFHFPKRNDWNKPLAIKSEGKIVGAVMCLQLPNGEL